MKTELSVMIGDGKQYQPYGYASITDAGEGPLNYMTVRCWTCGCNAHAVVYQDDECDDELTVRIMLERYMPMDDDCMDQPPVHLYLDLDQWEDLKHMVDTAVERTKLT